MKIDIISDVHGCLEEPGLHPQQKEKFRYVD